MEKTIILLHCHQCAKYHLITFIHNIVWLFLFLTCLKDVVSMNYVADDTQGNFLSNFARQIFLSNVVWALFHWEWLTSFYLDTLDWLWALCLTWLPVDGNIAEKVAPCIISHSYVKLLQKVLLSYVHLKNKYMLVWSDLRVYTDRLLILGELYFQIKRFFRPWETNLVPVCPNFWLSVYTRVLLIQKLKLTLLILTMTLSCTGTHA